MHRLLSGRVCRRSAALLRQVVIQAVSAMCRGRCVPWNVCSRSPYLAEIFLLGLRVEVGIEAVLVGVSTIIAMAGLSIRRRNRGGWVTSPRHQGHGTPCACTTGNIAGRLLGRWNSSILF